MTKKQTSVEWLIEQLTPSISLQQKHIDDLKEQAKAMHKEEIMNAFNNGYLNHRTNSEQYYNKTFEI